MSSNHINSMICNIQFVKLLFLNYKNSPEIVRANIFHIFKTLKKTVLSAYTLHMIRNIVITGGTRGIGYAIYKSLAESDNNKFVVISRHCTQEKSLFSNNTLLIDADISNKSDVELPQPEIYHSQNYPKQAQAPH